MSRIKTFKQYKNTILQDPRSEKLNFNKVDERYYYVYRITNTLDNTHYYGSRVSKNEPSFDLPRYGSSTKIPGLRKEIQLNENNKYRFKIVRIFSNNGDKVLYESYLHQYFNVKDNDKFWNLANQLPYGFSCKTNMIPPNTGKVAWYNNNTGKMEFFNESDEPIGYTKGSNAIVYGKDTSAFNTVWYHNPETGKGLRLNDSEIPPDGYVKGSPALGLIWYHDPVTKEHVRVSQDEVPAGYVKGLCVSDKSAIGTDKEWYYNPETNETNRFSDTDVIPEGWLKGNGTGGTNHYTSKTEFYHNLELNKQITVKIGEEPPEGFVKGKLPRFPYHNPVTNEQVLLNYNEPIPEGFVKGSKISGDNHPMSSRFWIHNPELFENKLIPKGQPIPEGWIKGRVLKRK